MNYTFVRLMKIYPCRLDVRAMKLPLNSVRHTDGESVTVTITKMLISPAVQEVRKITSTPSYKREIPLFLFSTKKRLEKIPFRLLFV